ncbi:general transcription factor 3C polypeptide 3 [Macrosteles quadrilineatus]|uniref:general transcription factor 3C polypeptide 3 n=1 Tax=Macrosteles quadrilineatus TaxID=74068 RepID=UPI0023E15943|nr:general transcription factor 3C polypeptide 3 [Macrosteles quadrilineatus]
MDVDEEILLGRQPTEGGENQDAEVTMDVDLPSESTSFLPLQNVSANFGTTNSDSEDELTPMRRTKEEEQLLTNKFLTGELTFSEYAAQYGENEEPFEDDEEGVVLSSTEKVEKDKKPLILPTVHTFEQNIAEIKGNSSAKKRSKGKQMRSRNNLPPALKGLMGEANLRYAKGEHEMAITMCFEVIRQFPWAPEPFETLASLYEEKGDTEKSLQVSLLAAHLNPRSSKHLWINLAEKSEDRQDFKQASTCYSKAIKADVKDFDLHMRLIAMLEKIGDHKSVLKAYMRLLQKVEPHHGEKIVEIAKMLTERYHKDGDLKKAKEALQIAFHKCPHLISSVLVNIMLEVLMGLKDFNACIDLLVKYCKVNIAKDEVNGKCIVKACHVPENIEIDIFAKLTMVIIHLGGFNVLDDLLDKIKSMNPEEAGDVYFDVAEALLSEKKFSKALELLTPLTVSDNYNLPAIWLKMAECLRALNRLEEAVSAYMVVVEKAPQLLAARLAVSELLTSLGRKDQALEVLTQDEDSEMLNTAMLLERCLLLQKMPDQKEQFIAVAQLFLSRHFVYINNREDLNALTTLRSDRKRTVLKENKNLQKCFSQGEEVKGEFSQTFNEPSVEEEWHLFWCVCEMCLEMGKFDTLQRLAFSAQGSQKFTAKFSQEIDLLCLSSSYYNADAYFGYNMVRALVLKNLNCERSWNMFNMMILRADDSRHNRFLMRLLIRNPHHKALTILHANNCLVAGTYKYALNDYTSVFQKDNSAMMAFLIAVTLCQMACQKFSAKKHSLVTQAVAYFWKYKDLRGREGLQESYYNIGRAFHQLGLLPPAIHHYKKALEFKSKFIDNYPQHLNLQREAAFNLHLIYMASGARDIARMYLEKYVVV